MSEEEKATCVVELPKENVWFSGQHPKICGTSLCLLRKHLGSHWLQGDGDGGRQLGWTVPSAFWPPFSALCVNVVASVYSQTQAALQEVAYHTDNTHVCPFGSFHGH